VISQNRLKVAGTVYLSCVGFAESEFAELVPKMRKADIWRTSVGRFGGRTIYRSVACRFVVVDADAAAGETDRRCDECRNFFHELDARYLQVLIISVADFFGLFFFLICGQNFIQCVQTKIKL
jgi:hypothetical protein